MLGPPTPRRLDAPVAVSLEDLVPADHCSRRLERALDLAFVRDLVAASAAAAGRRPIGAAGGRVGAQAGAAVETWTPASPAACATTSSSGRARPVAQARANGP